MLLITCPVCGAEGDDADFTNGGEAHRVRPASKDPENVSEEAQRDYLYTRKNPRGVHYEMWRCTYGCGKWFNAMRDTVSQRFLATYLMGEEPPDPDAKPVAKPRRKTRSKEQPE